MKIINKTTIQRVLLAIGFFFFVANPVLAESDKALQEKVLRAREKMQNHNGHKKHQVIEEKGEEFRGVFYGFLPCSDCAGVKTTLSLKNKHNYLLVTQYAQKSTREFYEKGKYTWDEKKKILTLKSRKDSSIKKYKISDEATLVKLDSDGSSLKGDKKQWTLRRSDSVKTRQVHIH